MLVEEAKVIKKYFLILRTPFTKKLLTLCRFDKDRYFQDKNNLEKFWFLCVSIAIPFLLNRTVFTELIVEINKYIKITSISANFLP